MANFPGNTRSGYLLLILLVLLLTLVSSVNLYLLLQDDGDGVAEAEAEEAAAPPDPIFVKVGPMTVNLQQGSYGDRLLYAGLSLKVGNEETRQVLATHMPEVHSRLLVLLSSQSAEELTAPGGKEALAQEIRAMFEKPLAEDLPPLSIHSVFFTDFIVQ